MTPLEIQVDTFMKRHEGRTFAQAMAIEHAAALAEDSIRNGLTSPDAKRTQEEIERRNAEDMRSAEWRIGRAMKIVSNNGRVSRENYAAETIGSVIDARTLGAIETFVTSDHFRDDERLPMIEAAFAAARRLKLELARRDCDTCLYDRHCASHCPEDCEHRASADQADSWVSAEDDASWYC